MYISQITVLYILNVYSAYVSYISTKLGEKRFRVVKKHLIMDNQKYLIITL